MDARLIDVRLLRAAAIVTVSFAMVCGLLILFGRVAPQAMAAPLADVSRLSGRPPTSPQSPLDRPRPSRAASCSDERSQ